MDTDRIEKKTLLHAPLKRIWRALADSTEFGTWFGMKFEGPFVAGASVRGVISPTTVDAEVAKSQKPHEGMAIQFIVERLEPKRLLAFRWRPVNDSSDEPSTLVTFALEQGADGVMLTVTESGFDQIPLERRAKMFAANEHGWSIQVTVIAKYLAHAR
jgi:uncharacterized protein YndB with AHSA1/START domain